MSDMKQKTIHIVLLVLCMIANLAYAASMSAEMLANPKTEQAQSMEGTPCHSEQNKNQESHDCCDYDCSNCVSGSAVTSSSAHFKAVKLSLGPTGSSLDQLYYSYSDNLYRPPIIS